jgi:hypothetical protein
MDDEVFQAQAVAYKSKGIRWFLFGVGQFKETQLLLT